MDPPSPSTLNISILKRLLGFPGDLLMLLHPGTFAEMVYKRRYNVESMLTMLNIDAKEAELLLSRKSHSAEELGEYYLRKYKAAIKNTKIRGVHTGSEYRDIIIDIPIRTAQSSYTLLYATRTTGGKDSLKWQEAFQYFARWIGSISDIRQKAEGKEGLTSSRLSTEPGKSLHDLPSNSLPPALDVMPPHCLKKNGTFCSRH